ncbi:unnamed protein product, partial [marine sediment metagenome]
SDILKIVKEDILEALGRKNKRISIKFMNLEVNVSHSFVSEAIKELEKEDLIKIFLIELKYHNSDALLSNL